MIDIKVTTYEEREDGSAIVNIEMDSDAKRYLIEQGFIAMLKTALEKDPAWWTEEDEARMDIVGKNGNTSDHYE